MRTVLIKQEAYIYINNNQNKFISINFHKRVRKMAQQKALASKPDSLSSIPRTHRVGEPIHTGCHSSYIYLGMPCMASVHLIPTNKHINAF